MRGPGVLVGGGAFSRFVFFAISGFLRTPCAFALASSSFFWRRSCFSNCFFSFCSRRSAKARACSAVIFFSPRKNTAGSVTTIPAANETKMLMKMGAFVKTFPKSQMLQRLSKLKPLNIATATKSAIVKISLKTMRNII